MPLPIVLLIIRHSSFTCMHSYTTALIVVHDPPLFMLSFPFVKCSIVYYGLGLNIIYYETKLHLFNIYNYMLVIHPTYYGYDLKKPF